MIERRKAGRPRTPEHIRFTNLCTPANDDGCILWQGAYSTQGYPMFTTRDDTDVLKLVPAQRHLYSLLNGPVPSTTQIRTICRTRGCVTPGHLHAARATTDQSPAARRRRAYRDIVDVPFNLQEFLSKNWARSQLASFYGLTEQQVVMIQHHHANRVSADAALA